MVNGSPSDTGDSACFGARAQDLPVLERREVMERRSQPTSDWKSATDSGKRRGSSCVGLIKGGPDCLTQSSETCIRCVGGAGPTGRRKHRGGTREAAASKPRRTAVGGPYLTPPRHSPAAVRVMAEPLSRTTRRVTFRLTAAQFPPRDVCAQTPPRTRSRTDRRWSGLGRPGASPSPYTRTPGSPGWA